MSNVPKIKVVVDNFESPSDSEESENERNCSNSSSSSSSSSTEDKGSQKSCMDDIDEGKRRTSIKCLPSAIKNVDTLVVNTTPKKQSVVKAYENKAGSFVTGFDPSSKDFKERQEMRVKRFGCSEPGLVLTEDSLQKLYDSLGMCDKSAEEDGVRLEAIHVLGVDDMSTQAVFDYFKEFAPSAIEWIDDSSCNVLWLDKITASRAMLKLSRSMENVLNDSRKGDPADRDKLTTTLSEMAVDKANNVESMEDDDELNLLTEEDIAKLSRSTITAEQNQAELEKYRNASSKDGNTNVSIKDVELEMNVETSDADHASVAVDIQHSSTSKTREPMNQVSSTSVTSTKHQTSRTSLSDENIEFPPGKWRLCIPSRYSTFLFMRFATLDDKKQPGAAKRSQYYVKYGNPLFGGMKGLISSSLKKKVFSRNMRDELREARKAVEAFEWKKGIPKETSFDRHLDEVNKRRQTTSKLQHSDFLDADEYDGNDLKTSENAGDRRELVIDEEEMGRLLEPPRPKKVMRMYADTLHQKTLGDRLGVRSSLHRDGSSDSSESDDHLLTAVWDRLEPNPRDHIIPDARDRSFVRDCLMLDTRYRQGDVRHRLGHDHITFDARQRLQNDADRRARNEDIVDFKGDLRNRLDRKRKGDELSSPGVFKRLTVEVVND